MNHRCKTRAVGLALVGLFACAETPDREPIAQSSSDAEADEEGMGSFNCVETRRAGGVPVFLDLPRFSAFCLPANSR